MEKEIAFVKVQPRKAGNFMVTIPLEAAKELGVNDNERIKVILDKEKKRIIYQIY